MGQPQLPSDLWDCRGSGMWLWSSHPFCHSFGESCNCSEMIAVVYWLLFDSWKIQPTFIWVMGLRLTVLHGLLLCVYSHYKILQITLFLNGWPHGSHHSERFAKVLAAISCQNVRLIKNVWLISSVWVLVSTVISKTSVFKIIPERHSMNETVKVHTVLQVNEPILHFQFKRMSLIIS